MTSSAAFEQIVAHGADGAVDDFGLVVEGHDASTPRAGVLHDAQCAALTRSMTVSLFSPFSMITMPETVSPLPSRVTAPCRGIGPTLTSATSRR